MPSFLFLDFDGVLSPGNTGTLRYAKELALLLAPYPDLGVVLTTNWRSRESLRSLKDWLDPALARRVVDAAPQLPDGDAPGGRQREIEAWLAGRQARAWLALDDTAVLYQAGCPWLFLTESKDALDAPTRARLAQRLRVTFS